MLQILNRDVVLQTEAPILIRPFLSLMTKSELHAVMVGGFATIAGGVLAAYIKFGVRFYCGVLAAHIKFGVRFYCGVLAAYIKFGVHFYCGVLAAYMKFLLPVLI